MTAAEFLSLSEHASDFPGERLRDAVQALDNPQVQAVTSASAQDGVHPLSGLIGGALNAVVEGQDHTAWVEAIDEALNRGFPLRLKTTQGERDAGHEVLDVLESLNESLTDGSDDEPGEDPAAAVEAGHILDRFIRRGWSPYEEGPTAGRADAHSVAQRIQTEGLPEMEAWLAEHEAALIDQGLPVSHAGIPAPRL